MQIGANIREAFYQVEMIRREENQQYVTNTIAEIIEDVFSLEPGQIFIKPAYRPKQKLVQARTVLVYILFNIGFKTNEIKRLVGMHPATVVQTIQRHNNLENDQDYQKKFRQVVENLPEI